MKQFNNKTIEVYPAINGETIEEIQEKIERVKPYTDRIHIDVADGSFTKNTIWHNHMDLPLLDPNLKIWVHLMIDQIDRRIEDWIYPNIEGIIFHESVSRDPEFVIDKCKKAGKKVGISISPDESLARAAIFKDKVDFFQILCVRPGLAGQEMLEECVDKIRELRKFCYSCIIEVDGGVNAKTIKKVYDAGANVVVAASAIFGEDDIEKAIKDLKNSV